MPLYADNKKNGPPGRFKANLPQKPESRTDYGQHNADNPGAHCDFVRGPAQSFKMVVYRSG